MNRALPPLVLTAMVAPFAAGYWLGQRNVLDERAKTGAAPSARPLVPPSAPRGVPPQNGGLRPQIRAAIERAPVRDERDLDRYLLSLEAQARRSGQVTALEIEPGLEMLRRHAKEPEKMARFSERMLRLQAELHDAGQATAVEPGEATRRLEHLDGEIQRTEGAQKQALIREYIELAGPLPPEQSLRFMVRLNEIAATDQRPDSASADVLWEAIQGESDSARRQDLIRDYIAIVHELGPAEQSERLQRLNARFGTATSDVSDGRR